MTDDVEEMPRRVRLDALDPASDPVRLDALARAIAAEAIAARRNVTDSALAPIVAHARWALIGAALVAAAAVFALVRVSPPSRSTAPASAPTSARTFAELAGVPPAVVDVASQPSPSAVAVVDAFTPPTSR